MNVFFALCDQRQEIDENDDDQDQQERPFICRMPEALKNEIKAMDESLMRDALHQPPNPTTAEQELADMLISANRNQLNSYKHILQPAQNLHVKYGDAGTGKNYLLHMFKFKLTTMSLNPIVLAPTGVSAYTIGGQTSDRFIALTLDQPHHYNPIRIDDYLKSHKNTVFLIDECSMLSTRKMEAIHEQLVLVTENPKPVAGFKTLFFADMAQLYHPLKKKKVCLLTFHLLAMPTFID